MGSKKAKVRIPEGNVGPFQLLRGRRASVQPRGVKGRTLEQVVRVVTPNAAARRRRRSGRGKS